MIVGRYGTFTIRREGRPKGRDGKGPGTVWLCNCPNGGLYPVSRCRHERAFFAHAKRVGEAIVGKPSLLFDALFKVYEASDPDAWTRIVARVGPSPSSAALARAVDHNMLAAALSELWDTAAGKTRVHLDGDGKRAVVRCPCIAAALGRPTRRGSHC